MAGKYDLTALNQSITNICLTHYRAHLGQATDPAVLADAIMSVEGFPMHYPCHHYLVPAVLLTTVRAAQNRPGVSLEKDLAMALERAMTVPGGSCGFQGCCGAAVGVGIFWTVITDCSPVSGRPWGYANGATAKALTALAELGGPRCCKRCTWLALRSSLAQIQSLLKVELPLSHPMCRYYSGNHECLRKKCPFHPDHGN